MRRSRALKRLEKARKEYLEQLSMAMEVSAELELHNENIQVDMDVDHDEEVKKLLVITSDLKTIWRAIRVNDDKKVVVRIYGTNENDGRIYSETAKVLDKSGLKGDWNPDTHVLALELKSWLDDDDDDEDDQDDADDEDDDQEE